jgi:nucleoside-diphosphate-sugar epimerase
MEKNIAVAGSTGFVGAAVIDDLKSDHNIVALTRSVSKMREQVDHEPVLWKTCRTHNLDSVTASLRNCDVLIYLIHSMVPSSRLTQASFQDLDLLLADNFAKACNKAGVKRIIYVSGIQNQDNAVSDHLRSRLEVENTLGSYGAEVITLRCGVIVGPGGSSINILLNLVKKLPIMVMPKWAKSKTQPIALKDAIRAVRLCLNEPDRFQGAFDIGCSSVMTYEDMLKEVSKILNQQLTTISVPFIPLFFSKRWVSVFGEASMSLVSPLVNSLKNDMVVKPNPLQKELMKNATSFADAVKGCLKPNGDPYKHLFADIRIKDKRLVKSEKNVCSVQRLLLPKNKDAHWVLFEYLKWLPNKFKNMIACNRISDSEIHFKCFFLKEPLLKFQHLSDKKADRQVLTIIGGLLVNTHGSKNGIMEFRTMHRQPYVIIAIHDFSPRLPWYIYNISQALFHLYVMKSFGRHLRRIKLSL